VRTESRQVKIEDFHRHLEIQPQLIGLTGSNGLLVLPQPGAPGNCRSDAETTEADLVEGNATQQFEVVEKLRGA
jgi:hypothetical protein